MISLYQRFYRRLYQRLAFGVARRRLSRRYGELLYKSAVRASRNERLFTDCRLVDTADGRLDSLTLHMYLYMRHFSPRNDLVLRSMMEFFVRDLDGSLRELGTSDIRVGKRVRGVLSRVYGAFSAYGDAESAMDWRAVLSRNIVDCDLSALCDYRASFSASLAGVSLRELVGSAVRVGGGAGKTLSKRAAN